MGALVESGVDASVRAATRNDQAHVKAELIAVNGPTCAACDTCMPDESLVHIHHVVPVERGGNNDRSNVALLCPNCHARAHWLDRKLTDESRPTTVAELLPILKAS